MSLKPSICRKITISIPECTETCDERLDALEQVVSEIEEDINVILVDDFPTEPQENIIYLVKNENGGYTFYQYDGTWRVIDVEFSNITSNGEPIEPLQPATPESLGGVIIGDGLVWNGEGRISVAASPEGGIPEAPIDGGSYVRKDGQWHGAYTEELLQEGDWRQYSTQGMEAQVLGNFPGYDYIIGVFQIQGGERSTVTTRVYPGTTAWVEAVWDRRRVRTFTYSANGNLSIGNGYSAAYNEQMALDPAALTPVMIYGVKRG